MDAVQEWSYFQMHSFQTGTQQVVYTKTYSEGATKFALGPRFTDLWSKRTTSNTLESDNTITTVRGLVNFLWQMDVCC